VRDLGNVDDILAPDGRFVVGKRDGRRAALQRQLYDLLGTEANGVDLVGLGLGDVPVLAEEASMLQPAVPIERIRVPGKK